MKFFQKILIGLCSLLPCFASVPQGSRGKTRELNKKVLSASTTSVGDFDPIKSANNPFSIILPSGSNRVWQYTNCELLNSHSGFISDSFVFGEVTMPDGGISQVSIEMEFDGTPFPTNSSELVMGFGFLIGLYGENSTISVTNMGVSGDKSPYNSFGKPFYSSDGTHALNDVVSWSPDNSSYLQAFGFDNGESSNTQFGQFPLYESATDGEGKTQNLKFTLDFKGNVGYPHKFLLVPFWVSMLSSSNNPMSFGFYKSDLGMLYRGLFDGFMISWNGSVNALDKYYSTLISTGYNDGYTQGQNDGYQSGLTAGKEIASKASYQQGYNKGYNDGSSTLAPSTTIWALFAAIAGVPTEVLNGMSKLTIWNVSLISTLFTLVFLALILWIIRKFI